MKKFQRITTAILTVLCILQTYPAKADGGSPFETNTYLKGEALCTPFMQAQTLYSTYGVVNGHDMLFTAANGSPALFSAYDLDENKLVFSGELKNAIAPWAYLVDSHSDVYVASEGNLYKYWTDENRLDFLGKAGTAKSGYGLCEDEDGNIYFGSYPMGYIIKYIPSTGQLLDYHKVLEEDGQQYVKALTYSGGYLYAGTYKDGVPRFFKINKNDPTDQIEIPLPYENKEDPLNWLNEMTLVDGKIFMFVSTKTDNATLMVYDTVTQKFIENGFNGKGKFKGLKVSPALNGKVYLQGGADTQILEYDLSSNQVTETGVKTPTREMGHGLRGAGLVTIENDPELPGTSVITMSYLEGKPFVYNPETKVLKELFDVEIAGTPTKINTIIPADENRILISCLMGSKAALYNTKTSQFEYFQAGQAENMVFYEGTAYLGNYPNAIIQRYIPGVTEKNAQESFFKMGEMQDRPLGLYAADRMMFVGTMPKYGELGGALGIYHFDTKELEVYRNIIKDQTITSVAYRDGCVYGTTGIWGGLGSSPTTNTAKIFVWDVKNKKLILEETPKIPGDTGSPAYLGKTEFGPDGLVWVAAKNLLFAYEPQTGEIKKHILLSSSDATFRAASGGREYRLCFDSDGLLYSNTGDQGILIVDTQTMEYKLLRKEVNNQAITMLELDSDENLLYVDSSSGTIINRIRILRGGSAMTEQQMQQLSQKLSEAIVLVKETGSVFSGGQRKELSGNLILSETAYFGDFDFLQNLFHTRKIYNSLTKTYTLLTPKQLIRISDLDAGNASLETVKDENGSLFYSLGEFSALYGYQLYPLGTGVCYLSKTEIPLTDEEVDGLNLYYRYFAQ